MLGCPLPTPKNSAEEAKEARELKKLGKFPAQPDPEEEAEKRGVMHYEYVLMFHYLSALLRRADGMNSVTRSGQRLFDIFAGIGNTGDHRMPLASHSIA